MSFHTGMLTINPINVNFNYTNKNNIKKNTFADSKNDNQLSLPNFRGIKPSIKSKSGFEFNEESILRLKNIFCNYSTSLCKISNLEIRKVFAKLQKLGIYTNSEILTALQQVTQFGSMKSLITIGEVMKANNVGEIKRNDISCDLGSAMNYLINQKQNYSLNFGIKQGIIIDTVLLGEFEELKKQNSDKFEKIIKNKNNLFFIVDGLENGISFLNRNLDLEKATKDLLEKSKLNNCLQYSKGIL